MRYRFSRASRAGTIVPTLAVSMIFILALIAFAIDIGLMALARTHCQNAADAAAMSSVRVLNGDPTNDNNKDAAAPAAKAIAKVNQVLSAPITESMVTTDVGYYAYNGTLQRFESFFTGSKPAEESWTATRVTINTSQPTFFAKIIGIGSLPASATATAVHRPRDVALVLDFSGSMKFSSETSYPSTGTITGSLNPDPNYPQFGHWSTFASVMRRTTIYSDSGGEAHAPNNLTMETDNGPAIVLDFLTRNSGGTLINAFHRPTSPYDPMTWACPAPNDWTTQADTTVTYGGSSGKGGDLWPRVNLSLTSGAYAKTAAEWLNESFSNSAPMTYARSTTNGPGGDRFDPPNQSAANATMDNQGYGPNFRGYSMGPGYYGKTFYMWPPDPRFHPSAATTSPETGTDPKARDSSGRWMGDWRKRFFFNGGTTTTLNGDNSRLWSTSTKQWRQASSTTYAINYNAIIAWLKSGPQVLPSNLRAGRVLYYSSIPDTIPSSGGTEDQRFWRAYIDYVIGNFDSEGQMETGYGRQADSDSTFGTTRITTRSNVRGPDGTAGNSDDPYMHYNDNPVRPRLNFWFGPMSMLAFLNDNNGGNAARNWLPGTCHEAQTWQLKAGVNSALDDIKKNHPNDWVGMVFFSSMSGYTTPRVTLGKDYTRMKNALFFPFNQLDNLSNTNAEVRPYDASYNTTHEANVPNANGGTCPESGFMMAYNELSGYGAFNGRRGASKMVIFETDGVPNTPCNGTFTKGSPAPYNSYYASVTIGSFVANGDSGVITDAKAVVTRICALDSASNPGYATARLPVRVHAIAFGDLFQTSTTTKTQALQFLLDVQKIGGTSPSTALSLDSYKIITGDYNTRIQNLRQAFERIMQSGVQVTLIR